MSLKKNNIKYIGLNVHFFLFFQFGISCCNPLIETQVDGGSISVHHEDSVHFYIQSLSLVHPTE